MPNNGIRADRFALAQRAIASSADNICARVFAFAQVMPDAEAVRYLHFTDADTTLTYAQLDHHIRAAAHEMKSRGITAGRPVLLIYTPSMEFVVAFLACQFLGAIAVPLQVPDSTPKRNRLAAVTQQMQDAAILCSVDAREQLGGLFSDAAHVLSGGAEMLTTAHPSAPDDLALLQFTSGSTGLPKGVQISSGNLSAIRDAVDVSGQIDASDVVLSWLPFEHDMGLIGGLLQPLWQGARSIIMSPNSFSVRPHRWLQAMSDHCVTTIVAPDSAYLRAARAFARRPSDGLDLSALQLCYSGSEPVRAETLRYFADVMRPYGFDPRAFSPCYGLAEASLLVAGVNRTEMPDVMRNPAAAVSVGVVPDQLTVRIVDQHTGVALPEGTMGEIWVAGPTVGLGYWRNTDETARVFDNMLPGELGRFMRTGDLGCLRGDKLFVMGRVKSVILRGGQSFFAEDLESAGESSAKIARAGRLAALQQGVAGTIWALQEVSPTAKEDDLRDAAARLRQVINAGAGVLVDRVLLTAPGSLQWTTSGKLQRAASLDHVLADRALILHDFHAPIDPASSSDLVEALRSDAPDPGTIERALCGWLAAMSRIDLDEIDPELPWADQAVDSLMGANLVAELEMICATRFADDLLYSFATPAELAQFLAERPE